MNESANDNKSDCYSAGERGWMELGQRVRATCLEPLLAILTRLGVTPDQVTILAAVIGVLFVPLWLLGMPALALSCIATHVLLDGIDGPLARRNGLASSRGSFTDTFADQVVVTGVMIAWMIHIPSSLNIAAGSIYVFLYALVVAMAMVRNAMAIPYSWLIRPRFFVYSALLVDYFSGWNLTLACLLVCIPLLAIKTFSGFIALRDRLPGA